MRWIAGGIAGWLAAVLPLIGVNIAGYNNMVYGDAAVVAGAVALFGGILLGGVVAGWMAGRPTSERAGGAAAALPAGLVAGILFIISLIAVIIIAIRLDAAPALVADHYLRITVAIICLGAILMGIALLVGMLVGRTSAAPRTQPQASRPEPMSRQPMQPRYPSPSAPYASQQRMGSDPRYRDSAHQNSYEQQADYRATPRQTARQEDRGEYRGGAGDYYRDSSDARDTRNPRDSRRSYADDERRDHGNQGNRGYQADRQPARYPPTPPQREHDDHHSGRGSDRREDWR
jgi:hypothetical protein